MLLAPDRGVRRPIAAYFFATEDNMLLGQH